MSSELNFTFVAVKSLNMKKNLLKALSLTGLFLASVSIFAQTSGTLTFTFTETAKSPTYNGNSQHVLAVWIQTSAGAFIKTKLRYAGSGTNDHLPTWASNAGCASSANCLGSACNIVDGTTGATRSSWTSYTITWDGKKGAATTGTLQPDGVYKVAIQSTWNHGTGGTATTTYTFTKGPNPDHQTLGSNSFITSAQLDWVPAVATLVDEEQANPVISVYPNPNNGVFNVDYSNAAQIKIVNTLGNIVFDEKTENVSEGSKVIDLSNLSNGIYMISVSNEKGTSYHKIILNK